MRLIDADALENAIDKERQILIEQQRLGAEHVIVHHARRLIEDAPTIDAIPVEWIKQKQSEIPRSSSWYVMMQFLMDMWKEEQEADHG